MSYICCILCTYTLHLCPVCKAHAHFLCAKPTPTSCVQSPRLLPVCKVHVYFLCVYSVLLLPVVAKHTVCICMYCMCGMHALDISVLYTYARMYCAHTYILYTYLCDVMYSMYIDVCMCTYVCNVYVCVCVCVYFSVLQLLQVIRENSIVIVVGETGSGKTTQLTQVSIPQYNTVHSLTPWNIGRIMESV